MITYKVGDATGPEESPAIIAHCCNDIGAWGAGFTKALDQRWAAPGKRYREWSGDVYYQRHKPFELGQVQFVPISDNLCVANIVGQYGIVSPNNPRPINYAALAVGLWNVARVAKVDGTTIVAPRIGAGLAGGDWKIIEKIIQDTSDAFNVDVVIYDLP